MRFYDPPQYKIDYCTSWTNFPVSVPSEQEKVWTFTEMSDGLKIYCNDVELLYYKFASSTDIDRCVNYWGKDTTSFLFYSTDTASDYYRVLIPGVCCGV